MKVAELLAKPENWTQGAHARDSEGRAVHWKSPEAVCWCLEGATLRCYPDASFREAEERLIDAVESWDYQYWNDRHGRTHAQVIALVQKAGI